MAEYVEFQIDQGTDFSTYINLNDDDTNLAQNVSGYVVSGKLRRSLVSANAAETFNCQITDPANGEIMISLAAANTANLRPGSYFYDIRVVDTESNNATSRLIEGIIIVSPAITK
jgi:hypothetical protein